MLIITFFWLLLSFIFIYYSHYSYCYYCDYSPLNSVIFYFFLAISDTALSVVSANIIIITYSITTMMNTAKTMRKFFRYFNSLNYFYHLFTYSLLLFFLYFAFTILLTVSHLCFCCLLEHLSLSLSETPLPFS